MNRIFATNSLSLSCRRHGAFDPKWGLEPFGLIFESLASAEHAANQKTQELGCSIFAVKFDREEVWSLALRSICADAIISEVATSVDFETSDFSNHPYHYIRSPFNVAATHLSLDDAARFAKTTRLAPGQKILLSCTSSAGWRVITSLTEEQQEVVNRLRCGMNEALLSEALSRKEEYELNEIYSFREFVFKVTDSLS